MIVVSMMTDSRLTVLPCRRNDIGYQRCWLGPQLMSSLGLQLCDTISVKVNNVTFCLCRVWPRLDGDGNEYIQFDSSVFASSDVQHQLSVSTSMPFSISKTSISRLSRSSIKAVSVTVVISDWPTYLLYRRYGSSMVLSNIRLLMQDVAICNNSTMLCCQMELGRVYHWDRIIVHEAVTSTKADCGFIVASSDIVVTEVCFKGKFEQKINRPAKVGGLSQEINGLKSIILNTSLPGVDTKMRSCRNVLITGPPGCGKKSLVRYVACDCDAYVISINTSIHSGQPGESEQNLRNAFQQAVEASADELCVLFLNELDAICPRQQDASSSSDALAARMLAELISLLDGLQESSNGRLTVIATTSKPTDVDQSLRRFGRFEKEIFVGIPGELQRLEILDLIVPHKALASCVDLKCLASRTAGYTGADLHSLLSMALVTALDHTQVLDDKALPLLITMDDFNQALHVVRASVQGASDMFISNARPISWNDIGGLTQVKEKLIQSIEWPRKHPEICRAFGLKPPRGILLYGPPGCAKTSLARAAAASCDINFLAASSAQLYSPYFGDAEKQIDQLFRQARACAPSLLFIDEIDSVIGSRESADSGGGGSSVGGGGSVQQRVLSALLTQMDGIGLSADDVEQHQTNRDSTEQSSLQDCVDEKDNRNVLVVAATNRLDMVDPALLRPGRMDYLIYTPLPDYQARLDILKVYTKNKPIVDVDLQVLASRTEGFTGADLENLCNEASLWAIHVNGPACCTVTGDSFEAVLRRVKPSVTAEALRVYSRNT